MENEACDGKETDGSPEVSIGGCRQEGCGHGESGIDFLVLHVLFSGCCDEDVDGASGIFVMVIRCYYQTGACDVKDNCQR